jgi:DNA (cytosine-5)-methyltransferase 1
MEGNVRLYRAKIQAGEMTEAEAEAILGKSVWEAQGRIPAMWPTPTTQEVEHPNAELTVTGRRKSKNGLSSHSLGLADAVQMWPTPTASSWGNEGSRNILDRRITDGTITPEDKRQMTSGNGGRLNPTWVEWLMGFPIGWTDLKD